MNYAIKINSLPTHPTYKDIFNPTNLSKFLNCPKSTKPLALRIKENLEGIKNYLDQQIRIIHPPEPPWLLNKPSCVLDLAKINKESLDERSCNIMLAELLNRYPPNFSLIFTDGSKFEKNVVVHLKWTLHMAILNSRPLQVYLMLS